MDEPLDLFFSRAAFPAPSDSPHTMFQLLSHPYSPSSDSLQSVRASPVPELGREEPPPPSTCWQHSPGGCWPPLPQGHVAGSWLICCPPGVPWLFLHSFAGSKSPVRPGTWGCSSPEAGLCTFLCWAPQNPRPAHFSSLSGSLWVAAQPSATNNSQFCVWNLRRLRKLARCRRLSTAFTALADLYPAGKGWGYEVTPNSQLREQQRSDLLARGSLSTLSSLLTHAVSHRNGYWKKYSEHYRSSCSTSEALRNTTPLLKLQTCVSTRITAVPASHSLRFQKDRSLPVNIYYIVELLVAKTCFFDIFQTEILEPKYSKSFMIW